LKGKKVVMTTITGSHLRKNEETILDLLLLEIKKECLIKE